MWLGWLTLGVFIAIVVDVVALVLLVWTSRRSP